MINQQGPSEYEVAYNAKDLILYALSIGMGSSEKDTYDELCFLYERHEHFSPVSTFCLALTFWARARNGTTSGIPSFPPPLMARDEVIPRKYLRTKNIDLARHPVIHTFQSIVWHQAMPTPPLGDVSGRCDGVVRTKIGLQTASVVPKSIGTFVTTQSNVFVEDPIISNQQSSICTMQSIALVLGISSDQVISYDSGLPKLQTKTKIPEDEPPILEWSYQTQPTHALLYRLSSGDSNRIHVDDSASRMLGSDSKNPLLHGLFTLAVAFRAVSKLVDDSASIPRLEGKFMRPAFVGDTLQVKVWKDDTRPGRFLFVVINPDTNVTLVDHGVAEFRPRPARTRSKL
jgi:acyl dehydratase